MSINDNQLFAEVRKTIIINAPIERVWPYIASSEDLAAWSMPNDMEPIVGKEFTLQACSGAGSLCKVIQVVPPHHLSFQWGDVWLITFELKALNDQTEVTLIHAGWDENAQTEFGEPHTIVRGLMADGWGEMLIELKNIVEA